MRQIIYVLLTIIVAGIGIVSFWWNHLFQPGVEVGWPTTTGEVLESTIDEDGEKPSFILKVRYKYSVDGVDYESQRIARGKYSSNDRALAKKIVDEYPVGQRVIVHYNPEKPSESFLII